jgi:phosphoenolpyruvate carboxylase
MKYCGTCKNEKQLSEFNKNKGKKDGLNTICRECSKVKAKEFYNTHKEQHLKNVYKNRDRYKEQIDIYITSVKSVGCKYCQEKMECCLDFHHLSDKEFSIGEKKYWYCLDRLIEEINKCVVICANCHRKLHAGIIA